MLRYKIQQSADHSAAHVKLLIDGTNSTLPTSE